jgi:hypothetical protein
MAQLARLNFTLPTGIRRERLIVCCCLILAQILFVSCNHVSRTNVNSSASNVNVSPDPQNRASLKAKVEALQNQPLGLSSLGAASAFESPSVTEIIAEGKTLFHSLSKRSNKRRNRPWLGTPHIACDGLKLTKGRSLRPTCIGSFIKRDRV